MTLNEFRAWLDGFSEGIDDNPTDRQWRIIKEKLKTVTAEEFNITQQSPTRIFDSTTIHLPASESLPYRVTA